ncbi:MAG: hypothetical protein ACYDBB_26500 [Armatimonadota bacterium]
MPKPKPSCRARIRNFLHLIGTALLVCVFIVLFILGPEEGWYRHYSFWLVLAGAILIAILAFRRNSQRSARRWEIMRACQQQIDAAVFSLTPVEALQQLTPLLQDADLFTLTPAGTESRDLSAYPPLVQELFAQYATITIDHLAVGTSLDHVPWASIADDFLHLPASYHLVGADLYYESAPLVVKDDEEAVYLLHNFDEPGRYEEHLAPTLPHVLLSQAVLQQKLWELEQ